MLKVIDPITNPSGTLLPSGEKLWTRWIWLDKHDLNKFKAWSALSKECCARKHQTRYLYRRSTTMSLLIFRDALVSVHEVWLKRLRHAVVVIYCQIVQECHEKLFRNERWRNLSVPDRCYQFFIRITFMSKNGSFICSPEVRKPGRVGKCFFLFVDSQGR